MSERCGVKAKFLLSHSECPPEQLPVAKAGAIPGQHWALWKWNTHTACTKTARKKNQVSWYQPTSQERQGTFLLVQIKEIDLELFPQRFQLVNITRCKCILLFTKQRPTFISIYSRSPAAGKTHLQGIVLFQKRFVRHQVSGLNLLTCFVFKHAN